MGRPAIRIGERHGSCVVIARDPSGTYKHPRYLVRCDCGTERVVSGGSFHVAKSCKSCAMYGRPKKYGDRTVADLKLYRSWVAMRRRCNPKVTTGRNARWSGRGITICPEWSSFEAFEKWSMSHGYRPGLSLDRVDNDGNYKPENCEWVTRSENSKRVRALHEMVPKRKFEPGITEWL